MVKWRINLEADDNLKIWVVCDDIDRVCGKSVVNLEALRSADVLRGRRIHANLPGIWSGELEGVRVDALYHKKFVVDLCSSVHAGGRVKSSWLSEERDSTPSVLQNRHGKNNKDVA